MKKSTTPPYPPPPNVPWKPREASSKDSPPASAELPPFLCSVKYKVVLPPLEISPRLFPVPLSFSATPSDSAISVTEQLCHLRVDPDGPLKERDYLWQPPALSTLLFQRDAGAEDELNRLAPLDFFDMQRFASASASGGKKAKNPSEVDRLFLFTPAELARTSPEAFAASADHAIASLDKEKDEEIREDKIQPEAVTTAPAQQQTVPTTRSELARAIDQSFVPASLLARVLKHPLAPQARPRRITPLVPAAIGDASPRMLLLTANGRDEVSPLTLFKTHTSAIDGARSTLAFVPTATGDEFVYARDYDDADLVDASCVALLLQDAAKREVEYWSVTRQVALKKRRATPASQSLARSRPRLEVHHRGD